ncbi:GrpB family protein [Alteribacillus sp. HJP-4]|uniref:GrpB family protein n=1 Tax=Alteribacillus sp. HJP-4 TaxID=2775394 RepID=UPI0035CD2A42
MYVNVIKYDKRWPQLFQSEARLLLEVFQEEIMEIHHIGSTSVPGLKAKPVIDIMPVVRSIKRVDALNQSMIKIGYEPLGENHIPGRRYFRKGGKQRTHHVHTFQYDNQHAILRHLAVRDYLRAHPGEAQEYGELKAGLAEAFPEDIYGYMDGKDEFVKQLEQKALEWKHTKK